MKEVDEYVLLSVVLGAECPTRGFSHLPGKSRNQSHESSSDHFSKMNPPADSTL